MKSKRNSLYVVLFAACWVGYIWLYYHTYTSDETTYHMCFIKSISDIPCPSCGTTRSILLLTQGNFVKAFLLNPLGYLAAITMLVVPVWVVYDIVRKSHSLYHFYLYSQRTFKNKKFAIPFLILLIFNWYWNILKGL